MKWSIPLGPAAYLVRTDIWPEITPYPIGELTFVRSIVGPPFNRALKRRVLIYPPSPIMHAIFMGLPGRCPGTYFLPRGVDQVLIESDTRDTETETLVAGLNSLRPMLHDLFNRDQDMLGNEYHSRARPEAQEAEVDPWMMPGIIETECLTNGLAASVPDPYLEARLRSMTRMFSAGGRAKQRYNNANNFAPDKYFSLTLSPYRRSTIATLCYPARSTFDRDSHLLATDLSWDLVERIVRYLADWSRYWQTTPRESVDTEEVHPYWSRAGRVIDIGPSREGPLARTYAGAFKGAYKAIGVDTDWTNRRDIFIVRVPPLEWVLQAIESSTS